MKDYKHYKSYKEELTDSQIKKLESKRRKKLKKMRIDEKKVLKDAHENINNWMSYNSENRRKGDDDEIFVTLRQWTQQEEAAFKRLQRVPLTFNKLDSEIKKAEGEFRLNTIDLKILGSNSNTDQEEINIREDLLRTISYKSQTKLVFQQTLSSQLKRGYGCFKLCLDYENHHTMKKDARFESITNPDNAFFDPKSKLPHMGDGDYCGYIEYYSHAEFESMFPNIPRPQSYPYSTSDSVKWVYNDSIAVAEYYVKEWYPFMLYTIKIGIDFKEVREHQWREIQKEYKEELERLQQEPDSEISLQNHLLEKPKIVRQRSSYDYQIVHYRLIKDMIIDAEFYPSEYLPVFMALGNFSYHNGKLVTKSFIHDAKDAQKLVNYSGSEIATDLKNRRREQWIGTPENIPPKNKQWRNPELQQGILLANPDPVTGKMPDKIPPTPINPSLFQQYQVATDDIKQILGFYTKQSPTRGYIVSGDAMEQQQLSENMSSVVFYDNLNSAIEQAGRALLDIMPYIYNENNREMTLTSPDGQQRKEKINEKTKEGIKRKISKKNFDVEIHTAPSFSVQKRQNLQMLMQISERDPELFRMIADIVAKSIDIQYAPQLVERFRTLVPDEILAKEQGKEVQKKPSSQEIMQQQQLQAQQQEMQMKQQEQAYKQEELKLKQDKLRLDEQEMMLKAKIAESEMHSKSIGHMTDIHDTNKKANIDKLKILTDLIKE